MGALDRWLKLRDWLSDDFLGGPKVLKASWVINAQKSVDATSRLLNRAKRAWSEP